MITKKYTNYATFLLLCVIVISSFPLLANPVPAPLVRPPTPDDISIKVRSLILLSALLVEFCFVIYILYLSKLLHTWRPIISIFIVHLVSYPTTLLLFQSIGIRAEIFPLVFEPWLFSKISKIQLRNSWHIIVIANLISFVLGIILPYAWFHLAPQPIKLRH